MTPAREIVAFRLEPPLHEELRQVARDESRTASDLFRDGVRVVLAMRRVGSEPPEQRPNGQPVEGPAESVQSGEIRGVSPEQQTNGTRPDLSRENTA